MPMQTFLEKQRTQARIEELIVRLIHESASWSESEYKPHLTVGTLEVDGAVPVREIAKAVIRDLCCNQ